MKTKNCIKCGNDFRIFKSPTGERINLEYREECLECKPLDKRHSIIKLNKKLKEENKKQCNSCNTIKELSDFYKMKKDSDKYKPFCKICSHKETQKQRQKINELLKSELSCSKCGYNKCIAALDFHHLDPNEKEISIANLIVNHSKLEKIKEEIKKCIVLCANCHRELHYNERQNEVE